MNYDRDYDCDPDKDHDHEQDHDHDHRYLQQKLSEGAKINKKKQNVKTVLVLGIPIGIISETS